MDWNSIAAAVPPEPAGRVTFRTRVREAVAGGAISLAALADLCQETAARHAATFGMGIDDTLPGGAVWVLGRLRLAIRHYPRVGQTIVVETWPAGLERRAALRAFRLGTAEDGVVGAALSSWSLFDLAARRPLGRLVAVFDRVPPPGPPLLELPPRPPLPSTLGDVAELTPRPAEIDVWGHVNNTHLIGWLLGGAHGRVPSPFTPAELDIAFRAECALADRCRLAVALDASGHFDGRLQRVADGLDLVRARARYVG